MAPSAYIFDIVLIETKVFSKQIDKLLDKEEYRDFKNFIINNYSLGDVIVGSGGIWKIRWKTSAKGKSSGIRVLYYISLTGIILLLLAYAKSDKEDLTPKQLKVLKNS